MKQKKKTIVILLIIFIIVVGFLFIKNKKYVQDDIIFFKLFGKGKTEEYQTEEAIYLKVDYKNLNFKNINLINTTNDYYKKIAPGTSGEFSIILSSNSNLDYQIKFQSQNFKPKNLVFSIKGKNKTYKNLEEMELKGQILKNKKKKITICWKWKYEIDSNEDIQDTEDGINLKNYNFTIYTIGGANET